MVNLRDYNGVKKPSGIPKYFAEAWNNKDAKKLASVFAEDADFVNVVGLWWHNRRDIEKAHDYGFRNIFPDSYLTVTKIKVNNISESVSVVHARMHLRGQSSINEKNAEPRRNIFTFVVQKRSQGWICVSAHNTDIVPGKETNISDGTTLKPVDYRN